MSIDDANTKDETIDNVDGTGSSGKERVEVDQQVNDTEELGGGEVGEMAEDGKVDTVKDAGGEKNVNKRHGDEIHQEHEMEDAEETVDSKGKRKKDDRESGENSGEEEGDEGLEKIEDDVEDEEKEDERMDDGIEDEEKEEDSERKGGDKKRRRRGRVGLNADNEKKDRKRSRDTLEIPFSFSPDRPVRERKAVVRLVEVIEKEQDEGVHVERGRGTPLKNIPNVARMLSKIKHEDLKLLHMIVFGRKGKAADFKSHILRFSGFVWHENEEKQKTKVHEKLEKCTMDQLLDLCHVLDIPVSSTSAKEDLIGMLLDFLIAPHASKTDSLLSESKQQSSTSKRKKSSQAVSPSSAAKHYTKKRKISGDSLNSMKVDAEVIEGSDKGLDERRETDISNGHENARHSESEENHESKNSADEDIIKAVKFDKKSKKVTSAKKSSRKKVSDPQGKCPETASGHLVMKEMGVTSKVFSRRKKADAMHKKKLPAPKLQSGASSTGEKLGKRKTISGKIQNPIPSNEEVRKMICQILKDVDFNTATFNDIFVQLGNHYKIDLMPRKQSIKSIVKEELTKLAEAEVEQEDVDDDGSDGIEGDNAQLAGTRL